jgi:hypothetical protein
MNETDNAVDFNVQLDGIYGSYTLPRHSIVTVII